MNAIDDLELTGLPDLLPPASACAMPPAMTAEQRISAAWAVLHGVPDPEVPVLSVCDLGIVREVSIDAQGVLQVALTPTYSGCPATEEITRSVQQAVLAAGLGPVQIRQRRAPAWTSDWISAAGREKLRACGIAPPCSTGADRAETGYRPMLFQPRAIGCPRCGSDRTERLSAFGATACKALHRCLSCREPFEHFKPI